MWKTNINLGKISAIPRDELYESVKKFLEQNNEALKSQRMLDNFKFCNLCKKVTSVSKLHLCPHNIKKACDKDAKCDVIYPVDTGSITVSRKWKMAGENEVNNCPQGQKSRSDKAESTVKLNGGKETSSSMKFSCESIKETELQNGGNARHVNIRSANKEDTNTGDGMIDFNRAVMLKAERELTEGEMKMSNMVNISDSAIEVDHNVQIKDEIMTAEDDQHIPSTGLNLYANAACSICILRGKSESISHICFDCKDVMCNSCAAKHTYSRYTINHKLVAFSPETWKNMELNKAGGTKEKMCTDHPQEQLVFFCKECICLVCKVCLGTKHLDHPFVNADLTVLVHKNDLQLLQKVIKEKVIDLKDNLEENNNFMRELKQKEIKEVNTIQQIVSQMVEEMKKKEQTAVQEISTEFDKLQNIGVKENKNIGTTIHCLNEVQSWTDMLLAKSKDNQDFISVDGMIFKSFMELLKKQELASDTIGLATMPSIEQSNAMKSLNDEPLFDICKSHQKPDPLPTRRRYIYIDFMSNNPVWIGEINVRIKGSAEIPGNLVKLHLKNNHVNGQTAACSNVKEPGDLQKENLSSDCKTPSTDSTKKRAASSTITSLDLKTRDKSVDVEDSLNQMLSMKDDMVNDQLFVGHSHQKSKADTSLDESMIKRRKLIEILDQQNPLGKLKKKKRCKKKSTSLVQAKKTIHLTNAELSKWRCKPSCEILSDNSAALGEYTGTENSTQSKAVHANFIKNIDSQCQGSKCNDLLSTDDSKLKLTPAYRLDVRLPTDKTDPKISGIAFIGQGRFAVSDFDNNKIKVFFTSGVLWNEWHAEQPKYVSFVAGRLAWSSRNCVCLMNVKLNASGKKTTWAIQVATQEQEVLPHPITSLQSNILIGNGHYLVEAKFFSQKNEYVITKKIVPKSDTGEGIRKVQNICGGVKGKTIICNWDHKSAVFVDAEGKASATYTERNHNPNCLPMGIYVPKRKQIVFLLDCTGHRLLLLDANAKLLQEWSTQPAVSRPWSLSGDNKGELFITGIGPYVNVFSYEPCKAGINESKL